MTAMSSGATKKLSGRKVLVVEDDYFIAQEVRRMLEHNGADVLGPVATIDHALAAVASEAKIDAAVLDVNLRDVMSYSVADALRARGVPFVFATGYERATVPDRFASVQHCEKPIDIGTLVNALMI